MPFVDEFEVTVTVTVPLALFVVCVDVDAELVDAELPDVELVDVDVVVAELVVAGVDDDVDCDDALVEADVVFVDDADVLLGVVLATGLEVAWFAVLVDEPGALPQPAKTSTEMPASPLSKAFRFIK